MYHIKEDRRSQASAESISRGLQKCLKTMPLKNITVSDIHRASGVSRATFYRLFDTPDDVLHYQFERMARELEAYQDSENHLVDTIAQGMQYHELIRALVENRRFDLLFEATEKSFQRLDRRNSLFPEKLEPVEREYLMTHLSMSMVAILITWVRNGRRESPEDVAAHLRKCFRILGELLEPDRSRSELAQTPVADDPDK